MQAVVDPLQPCLKSKQTVVHDIYLSIGIVEAVTYFASQLNTSALNVVLGQIRVAPVAPGERSIRNWKLAYERMLFRTRVCERVSARRLATSHVTAGQADSRRSANATLFASCAPYW